ncbi:MAG TPA: hypothetical protein DD477_06130 [Spirochaetaceae bacterium]|nr:hypothetical protein [Spirochaetaceae bacterium]HAX38228.1 hypothetical protein [Spirochaetaceae bacterium]HBO40777.1 hypothetical protein [Spirochaetaceae bacterium]
MANIIAHIGEHETSVRPLTIQYCAGLLKTEILRLLATGSAVNVLDICTAYLGVKGGVSGDNPSPTELNRFELHCTPTTEAHAITTNLSTASVNKTEPGGFINRIVDLFSSQADSRITAGRSLRLSGQRLRVTGDDPRVGIYFVDTLDAAVRIQVPASYLTCNRPGQLEFFVPDQLAVGQSYRLELVSQYSSGDYQVKEPRVYASPVELLVVA